MMQEKSLPTKAHVCFIFFWIFTLSFTPLLADDPIQDNQKKQNVAPNSPQNPNNQDQQEPDDPSQINQPGPSAPAQQPMPRIVREIHIHGNKTISSDAIRTYIPYREGEPFDPNKARFLIHNLYFGLENRFKDVSVKAEPIGTDEVDIHVFVQEKHSLIDVKITGAKAVTQKDIIKKVDFDIPSIQEEELKVYAERIKAVYVERGYHGIDIDYALEFDESEHVTALFTIHEGTQALIKEICFEGNTFVSAKELRSIIYTREDWILSFMDQGGLYIPEKIEADKHMIEQYYQNRGFVAAKVINTRVEQMGCPTHLRLVFDIEEGDQYYIESVSAPGNDILSEEVLLQFIPIRPGNLYSRERVTDAIKYLERVWGNHGYVFAHIEPSIQPDEDTRTVKLSFHSDIGDQIYLNRVTILGNKKTRDKVIRRRLVVEEGEMLTQGALDISKANVESLGYFEARDGVDWALRRIDEQWANADLLVKEMKTGHFSAQLNYGGDGTDLRSPITGISFQTSVSDTNLFGSGIHVNADATWAKDEQTFAFHLAKPYLFEKPITGGFDIYHRRPTYDSLQHLNSNTIHEKLTGGNLTVGFITDARAKFLADTSVLLSVGVDSVRYGVRQIETKTNTDATTGVVQKEQIEHFNRPTAVSTSIDPVLLAEYQCILDQAFKNGDYAYLALSLENDHRNHPIHPSRGHKWKLNTRLAIPSLGGKISYYRTTAEAHWFTPIIGEQDLVLRLHGFLGFANKFSNYFIPYNEAFQIGGQTSVRGFQFGQISPEFLGSPIGASKAMFVNVELAFPITQDLGMKGVVFYDGGVGFDTPYAACVATGKIARNNFDYRHSIGFGLRMLNPAPVRIDWGFKIDPRRDLADPRKKETSHEVHFSMSYDW